MKIVELNDSPKKPKKGEAPKPTGAKNAKKNATEPAKEELVEAPSASASAKKKKKKNKKKNKTLDESADKEAAEAASEVAPPVAEPKESADAAPVAAAPVAAAPVAAAPVAAAPVAPAPVVPAAADAASLAPASEDKSGEPEKTATLEKENAPPAVVEKPAEDAAKQPEEKDASQPEQNAPMDTSSAAEKAAVEVKAEVKAEVTTTEGDKAASVAEVAKEEKIDLGASVEIPAEKLVESIGEPSENGGEEPSKPGSAKKKKNKKNKNKSLNESENTSLNESEDVNGSTGAESKKRKNDVSASESPSKNAETTPAKKNKTADGAGGDKTLKLPGGLVIHEQNEGSGDVAKKGAVCMIKYTGRLKTTNKVFDSNAGPRESPLKMVLGKGDVIQGFDEGIEGMKVGGKRRLIIPPHKAYGKQSPSRDIPPNSALIFDIELVKMAGKKK